MIHAKRAGRVARCLHAVFVAGVAAWAVLAMSVSQARQVALLVGVGRYADPSVNPLDGPPEDVRAMEAELTRRWGFHADAVRTLIDAQATRRRIVEELAALDGRTAAGDLVFIYFSGHGTSAEDPGMSLPLPHSSGAFVPHDFPLSKGLPADAMLAHLVIGRRDLRPVLSRLERAGRKVFVVSDSCYSGEAVRSLFAAQLGRGRQPARVIQVVAQRPAGAAGPVARRPAEPYPYRDVVYLSAASEYEQAVDIPPWMLASRGTVDGRPHGALTDALLRVLRGDIPADVDRDGSVSYAELHRAVQRFLSDRGFGQTPRLLPPLPEDRGGLARQAVLGGVAAPAGALAPPVPVDEALRVALDAGVAPVLKPLLQAEPGIEVSGPGPDMRAEGRASRPIDVRVVAAPGGALRLLGPAADQMGLHAKAEAAAGHLRQLAWAKRLRAIGERGAREPVRIETLPSGQGAFVEGQRLSFMVQPPQASALLLFVVDSLGQVTVLYPARDFERRVLPGGRPMAVPGTQPKDLIEVRPPFGVDLVFAFAFPQPPDWLAQVQGLERAEPGASRLIDLERRLRALPVRGYAFGDLSLVTVPKRAPPGPLGATVGKP